MKNLSSAATVALLAMLGAACDSGTVDHHALAHTVAFEEARTPIAAPHGPRPPAYFGDEYADAQRALPDRRDPFAPTF